MSIITAKTIKSTNTTLSSSFKYTNLDLENPSPDGGPNRTNSNIGSGQYTVTRAGGMGFSSVAEGGGVVTKTLHSYTSQNTYLDNNPIQTSEGFTPKDNIADPNNANGFDATIK